MGASDPEAEVGQPLAQRPDRRGRHGRGRHRGGGLFLRSSKSAGTQGFGPPLEGTHGGCASCGDSGGN